MFIYTGSNNICQMSHRKYLLDLLKKYKPHPGIEELHYLNTVNFIQNYQSCFERSLLPGHIVGSAIVVDESRKKVLLMNHKKLNMWIQFGGHSDGNPNTLEVAKRELEEESGIKDYNLLTEDIFDIDVHKIPERGEEPEHLHYDIRFIMEVAKDIKFQKQESEVNDIKWFSIDELSDLIDCDVNDRLQRKLKSL